MICNLFPSPLGASYFQIFDEYIDKYAKIKMFPSPLGASYFQIMERLLNQMME